MNPLSILVDARPLVDPNSGGVGRVTRRLLERLVATEGGRFRFLFVTTGAFVPALAEPFASHPSVCHVHLKRPNKYWSLSCMLGLASLDRAVERRSGETIHAALLPNLGFTGRLRVPYALLLHDLSFMIEPHWFPWRMRLWHRAVRAPALIRGAAHLFSVSETTSRDARLLLGIPGDRISLIRPGTQDDLDVPITETESMRRDRETAEPYVMAFGETNPRKNVQTAIAAVEKLRRESFPDLHIILIGSRADPSFRSEDWIVRKNRTTDDELFALYRNARALLYPSWYEGFGLPLHEAARFGTPCLASSHGALPETAPPGTLFIPPAKPHLWASMLREVLRSPERYRTKTDPSIGHCEIGEVNAWLQTFVNR